MIIFGSAVLRTLIQKVTTMSETLDQAIAALQADNAQLKADIAAIPAAIATQIADAIAAQSAAGVTPEQMQALTDLHTALVSEHTDLQAALTPPPPAAA